MQMADQQLMSVQDMVMEQSRGTRTGEVPQLDWQEMPSNAQDWWEHVVKQRRTAGSKVCRAEPSL